MNNTAHEIQDEVNDLKDLDHEYKYGFHYDDVSVFKTQKGGNHE